MKIGSKIATIALSAGLAVAGIAGPARAELANGSTATTFTLTAGLLTMTTPAAAVLTPASAGATSVSGSLGLQTVADLRGALNNGWIDTVSSTTFVLPGATPTANETVALANIAYTSGAGTVSANGTFTAVTGVSLASPATGGTHSAGAGVSTTTWTPSLTLTLLSSQVAGVYSGTITHSVA